MSARERILARVRSSLEERPRALHPGPFRGARAAPAPSDLLEAFSTLFVLAGGEVVRVADEGSAATWVREFADGFASVTVGTSVPAALAPSVTVVAPPEVAELGISLALGAVAETGSLLLPSRDGRRVQLLPPTHLVLVPSASVHPTLAAALASLRPALPAAVGLHSGPSKSADIGQILVRGVHGPGRVVALVIGA